MCCATVLVVAAVVEIVVVATVVVTVTVVSEAVVVVVVVVVVAVAGLPQAASRPKDFCSQAAKGFRLGSAPLLTCMWLSQLRGIFGN